MTNQFILTKKIAKHGSQAIIVIPKILEKKLRPKTIVKVTIDILEEANEVNTREVKEKTNAAEPGGDVA